MYIFKTTIRYSNEVGPNSTPQESPISNGIRILLTCAALYGIDTMAADIGNAYFQTPTSEKYFVICGYEFGIEHVGKRALIVHAIYGGKCTDRDL